GADGPGCAVGRVDDDVLAILLDRHSEWPDERLAGELSVAPHRHRDRDQPAETPPPPCGDGRAVGGKNDVTVEHETPDPHLVDFLGLTRRKLDHVAILLHDG